MSRFTKVVRSSWLYNKLFNPYTVDHFTVPVERGTVRLKRVREKPTVSSFFQSTWWTAGGPMVFFVLFGWAALYWAQKKRVMCGNTI